MLQLREKIPYVNSDTNIVGMFMQLSGCNCNCKDCNGCTDCIFCANLTLSDIVMNVYRKGLIPDKQYFVQYEAYFVQGVEVQFFIDDILKEAAPGHYVGDIVVRGSACGSVELLVGDNNTVFSPYTQ
jgi:hypothetical protein